MNDGCNQELMSAVKHPGTISLLNYPRGEQEASFWKVSLPYQVHYHCQGAVGICNLGGEKCPRSST